MTPVRRGEAGRLALSALVVVAWIACPGLAVHALTRDVAETSFAEQESAWVPTRELSHETELALGLALVWSPGPTAVAPAWAGLVELVHATPGRSLVSGDPVAVVGGVTRIAHAGERPFSRSLAAGDTGPDVAVLNEFLAGRDLPHAPGDRFTSATRAGVRAFAVSVGAGRQDAFDPSWLLHLSAPEMVVASIDLTVGAPVPDAGRAVVEGRPVLAGAQVTTQDFAARAASVARSDVGSSPLLTARTLEAVAAAIGDDARAVPPDAELRSAGVTVTLGPARDRLDDVGVLALGLLVSPGAVAVDAVAVTPPVPGQWVVPAAAVFATEQGESAVRRERDGISTTIAVDVVGSDGPSTAVITGDLLTNDRVELSPAAVDRSVG